MTTLGNYELVRPIGRGTSGMVYEAIHRTLGRRVALKVLDVAGADEEGVRRARTRFLREGRAAARVKHPNVVDVFDCGTLDGQAYLAMEFVEGESLARLLRREGRLSVSAAVDLALPLLSAVAELHAAGILHRDIKPANILLQRSGDRPLPKLSDFGVSRVDDGSPTITHADAVLGTPGYLAPELARGAAATEASDQYALAATVSEMVTGQTPRPEGPRDAPAIPRALARILRRAMHPNPDSRFRTLDEFAAALAPLGTHAASTGAIASDVKPTAHSEASAPAPLAPFHARTDPEQDAEGVDAARLRRTMIVGAFVWAGFFPVDLFVTLVLGAATVTFFAVIRIVVLVEMLAIIWCLAHVRLSDRARIWIEILGHSVACGGIAIMCVRFNGIASPYAPGICLVLVHRTLASSESWRRGLVRYGIPASLYPVVLLGAAPFEPAIAHELHDTRALVFFGINLAFVYGTAALAAAGGHTIWTLKQAVFEAKRLGRYKLKRRIGRGATGEVWLAHHGALKRDVAVKILRPEACTAVAISRFEREAQATAELTHPNTVRVFDFGVTEDGLRYYAMELLEGETLAELVRREGPLPAVRAVHLALQAVRALAEAHGRGIVHRDVKPSNLLVTSLGGESDYVKVLDFGIARLARSADRESATLTREGGILGTPAYMSPEAVLGEQIDVRADVYSLGGVLYFMLTGLAPFETRSEGPVGLMMAQVNAVPERPSTLVGKSLPRGLEDVVMRCLAKSPGDRYPDAASLVAALAPFAAKPHGEGDRLLGRAGHSA